MRKPRLPLLLLLLLSLFGLSQPAWADWGSMFRSITSGLGGNSNERSSNSGVATIGSRGYLGDDLKSANPDPNAVKTLDKWKATQQEATADAKKRGLAARDVNISSNSNAPAPNTEVQP